MAAAAFTLEEWVSQVEGLAEPLEVQDPRDSLTHNPEVVPEKETTHDVNRVLATGD